MSLTGLGKRRFLRDGSGQTLRNPTNPPPSKWQRLRAMKREGASVYPVGVGPTVIEAMIMLGMPEADTRDRAKVRANLEKVVQEWADKVVRK